MATVKEINHDSSTNINDHYSSVTDPDGAITVSAGNALDSSTYGVGCDYDTATVEVRLQESFTATGTEFRWRMRFDLSSFSQVPSLNTVMFSAVSRLSGNPAGTRIATFEIRGDNSGGFEGEVGYFIDTSGFIQTFTTVAIPSSSEFCVEAAIVGETFDGAADGAAEWWLNGVSQDSVSGIENFNRMGSGAVVTRIDFYGQTAGNTGNVKYDEWIIDDSATSDLGCAVTATALAAMTKPADTDAAGEFVYVALLEGGVPILTKISTALDSDGVTVFNPGSGDNIGVQCGRFDSRVVWVAGNFGGTDVIEKSEDSGGGFSIKDPSTFDPVTSFVVGPDSDDRVLVFADAGGSVASSSIQETIDSGTSWEEKASGLGFASKALARLDINVEEIVTGNEAGASDNIHYSPNTGEDLEDYSTGFPTQDVTKVIVG